MSIRYVRDGLKIVRVEEAPSSVRASRTARHAPDLGGRLRAFNAGILADARRSGVAAAVTATFPGQAIRLARAKAGRSQRQLALELGMSRSMIAGCERGRRTVPFPLARWAAEVFAREDTAPGGAGAAGTGEPAGR